MLCLQKSTRLLAVTNSWIYHDKITFAISLILVALDEHRHIRIAAGQLLNIFVKMCVLTIDSIALG